MNFLSSRNLAKFIEGSHQKQLIIPILSDHKKHWAINQVSFVYFYNLETFQEWIVGINHNDCESFTICVLSDFFDKGNIIYHKKYLVDCGANHDANLAFWMQTNGRLDEDLKVPPTVKYYWNLYKDLENINDVIPIMKWLDYVRDIKDVFILNCRDFRVDEPFLKYDEFLTNLALIEKNGIGTELSEYNPFTHTGRPSNHFNNVNYAALNKADGNRKRFVSRFREKGILMEIDLSGFHLFLIYMLLEKPFPKNIYEELGKLYFGKQELTKEEIAESKVLTFRQIYGNISKEYWELEPFKSIRVLQKQTYISYQAGTLRTFLYHKKVPANIEQHKLFNYMLQNFETEFNAEIIKRLIQTTKTSKTKLILYTYDSFLFDYCFEDGKELLENIMKIFNNIPFKMKYGTNYHEMYEKK